MTSNNIREIAWQAPAPKTCRGQWYVQWDHRGHAEYTVPVGKADARRLAKLIGRHAKRWGHDNVWVVNITTSETERIYSAKTAVRARRSKLEAFENRIGYSVAALVQLLMLLAMSA